MARPSVIPLFATSGTNRTRPSAFELDGYPTPFPPPAEFHNWQFGVLGDWIEYLDQRATPFGSLADLIDATAPGEAAYVWRPYGQNSPFELEETLTGASEFGPMTGDGSRLFLATGTTVQSFATDDLTTPLVTFALSGTATAIAKLVCNGTHLLVKYTTASNDLYDLFLVDGTLLGTRSAALASTSDAAAMNGTHAFVVTTNTVQQVPLSNFSAGLTLEYDHTAVVSWIALHANQLVVYGAARVGNDGFALTGDRLIGLVPAGAGMTPLWGTTRTITPGTAVSDGNLIYSVSASSGTELSLTNWGIGIANRANMTITEDVGANFADGEYADGEYFYLLSQGLLYVYDRATFGCVARLFIEETETGPGHVFSDGDQVYVSTADTGVSYTLRRYSIRSGRPRLFGRQDPADKGKTFHNVLAVAQ